MGILIVENDHEVRKTLEQTLAEEGFIVDVAEDGGIDIASLRIGYQGLEDARWFALDDLPAMPPPRSISRYILDNFLFV